MSTNIQFSNTSDGSDPYTLPVNPASYSCGEYVKVVSQNILHGAPAWQEAAWDGRIRSLFWTGFYVSTADDSSGFAEQVFVMEGWKGSIKYVNFNNLEDLNTNWPTTNTWKKCRIINVGKEFKSASESSKPAYSQVVLYIQPEQ